MMNERPDSGTYEQQQQDTVASEFAFLARTFLEKLKVPKQDIEKNIQALFAATVSKMDLVTRDELERQQLLLKQAQTQLTSMQEKVRQLEALVSEKHT